MAYSLHRSVPACRDDGPCLVFSIREYESLRVGGDGGVWLLAHAQPDRSVPRRGRRRRNTRRCLLRPRGRRGPLADDLRAEQVGCAHRDDGRAGGRNVSVSACVGTAGVSPPLRPRRPNPRMGRRRRSSASPPSRGALRAHREDGATSPVAEPAGRSAHRDDGAFCILGARAPTLAAGPR